MIQLFPFVLTAIVPVLLLGFLLALGRLVFGLFRAEPLHAAAGPLILAFAVYGVLLVVGSVASRERRVSLGTPLCFDDWCVAVGRVRESASGDARIVSADVHVISDAKRVTQRGSNPRVSFIDDRGVWYAAHVSRGATPLSSPVEPGESFGTRVEAAVPSGARITAIRVWEGGWIDCFIPFDEESPFHRKTFYTVDAITL